MSNDVFNVDHSIALCALGWKPLDIMRKKAKATMMYKNYKWDRSRISHKPLYLSPSRRREAPCEGTNSPGY